MNLLWVAPLGFAVGIVLGALGGGGAILTVPILVYFVGQSPTAATTGSLVVVGIASIVGLLPHRRAGNVRMRDGLIFGVLGTVGSLLGSLLNTAVPSAVLMTMFGGLMLAVAALMTRKRRRSARAGADEAPPERRGMVALVVAASLVGLLTGFFGVGGGFAVVPALVLVLGFSMPAAVGTSLLVIVINSITALGARIGTAGDLDWPLILTFGALAAVGSLVGGKVAGRVDPQKLNLAFTILLVLVAGYTLAQNVPQLLG